MGVVNYVKETKGELKHVSWPTRRQAIGYTVLVIAVSLVTAFYLGLFDFLFSLGLEEVLKIF
ncbi:MAG: preprotein translocase subunit SecE [bacterium]|nr:preprotein translocase subunit SecE [bacterium]